MNAETFSIAEFCAAHKISKVYLHKLWREGRGPRRMQVGRRVLITVDAAREWRDACEANSNASAA